MTYILWLLCAIFYAHSSYLSQSHTSVTCNIRDSKRFQNVKISCCFHHPVLKMHICICDSFSYYILYCTCFYVILYVIFMCLFPFSILFVFFIFPQYKTGRNCHGYGKVNKTSTTPSCSGPIPAQKSRGNSVIGVVFSHTMSKMKFHYSHRFSLEKTH